MQRLNWRNAKFDEYNALIKNKTWTSVPRPEGTNIVRCMWLFLHKFLADGTLSRYKVRLVANGSPQVEGVDVDETFCSVVKSGTIRTVLSLAISRHWPVHQLDVKNAFYMGDDTAFLLLYVDDIVLTASSDRLLQQIIASLHREFFMTDLGALNYFLEHAHMVGCNPSRTPVDTESKLEDGGTPVVDPTLYRSLAGTLDYDLQLFSSTTDSLIAYSDADWAGYTTTRQSTLGYCVFLGNNLLSWSSKRQPTLSRSSVVRLSIVVFLMMLLRHVGNILSGSPCLETLELYCCNGVRRIDVASNSVKNLVLSHYGYV
nr:hypothetical protein [Tanacetum cinerariifolium]